ncbi:hypothetical protein PAF17_08790 [Paracoccus sp. Z330]|uniref:Uncharacterized protein n=1 Tax=Paracoccus onchidii TaxID=3017813 RepID=A0ABT4ZE43_9RHOB|nr:hypothetical protein [Paracoccus onchidii]MDB6177610.1 hypothetical protein [Paracoccus onchidii]
MPFDASYEQLMRLLATRGLEWLRQQVLALPDPVPDDHPSVAQLALMSRIAPVLSGLRGHVSPLEDIVSRRLTSQLVQRAANRYLSGDTDRATVSCVLGGRIVAGDDPIWQLAVHAIAAGSGASPVDRLAAGATADGALLATIEADLCHPIPNETLTDAKIDSFAFQVMQLYQFGATRPKFSNPRVYGNVFTKLVASGEWAMRNGRLTSMCQIAYCLRLIDPDHDISDLIADIISHQRPDGSFPRSSGYSTQDQDLATGTWPTLMALAVLNFTAWQKWRGPRPDHSTIRPFTTSRNSYAAAIAPLGKEWAAKANTGLRLKLACGLTRATGENWFSRLGLKGLAPNRTQILSIATQLFGDVFAARNARDTLQLHRHWPADLEAGEDAAILRWLRGAPVMLAQDDRQPAQCPTRSTVGDDDFDRMCLSHAKLATTIPDAALKAEGLRHAWQALVLMEQDDGPHLHDAIDQLERLNRLVQIFESEAPLSAAA